MRLELHTKATAANWMLGAAAVALIKAGAEMDKKDSDGILALDLAPDKEVSWPKSGTALPYNNHHRHI